MKRKYLFGMLMFIFVVAILAACGDGPTSSSETDEEETETDKTVINFWTPKWGESEEEWFNKWIEKYNSSQDEVLVKMEVIPGDAWDQKITAAQASGDGPDITTMNYNKIIFSADQGKIKALDEYVDPAIWDDLHDNIESFVTYKDKHYAMPLLAEPSSLLYYRKDFFEEAGLDPEQPPKTWDELIEYGKKLKQDRRSGLTAAGTTDELAWTHWGIQGMTGCQPISEDWSKSTINSENCKQLFEFWDTLYDEEIMPVQMPGGYTDIQAFAEGRTAMTINGSWAANQLKTDFPDVVENVGVAVLPTPDGNQEKTTASLGGWTLTIDGNSEHPQEAADFISYLLAGDTEILVEFFRDATKFSKFSARQSVDEAINQDPDAQSDPWRKLVAEEIIPYAIPEPIYAWDISLAYATALERVYKEDQDVEKSLTQAEKEINDYIKANEYAGTNPK
ncbi:ABC transporter substrate-binding protein [Gracilibacillus sp. D59]|uniref:ABC transporter substrate-binding protein n=1 Tax=Gracilibacillus sp. D59 TaxID=3457434 RepID=UPI003FCE9167